MKDDGKTVVSLASKREEQDMDFGQVRDDKIKQALELGLSIERAAAIADSVMLCDWLVYQAARTADRWEVDPAAVIGLLGKMTRGQ